MLETTVVRNAGWVVGWDREAKRHVYLRDADVAFTGKVFTYVGKSFQGGWDHEIDGTGLMVMPGLVNVHSHAGEDTYLLGLNESGVDAGRDGEAAFYEYLKTSPRQVSGIDVRPLSAELGYAEMLAGGTTTIVDVCESTAYPDWIETLERSGLRAHLAPAFPSFTSERSPKDQLTDALAVIDEATASATGRLRGAVLPFDLATVPADLLRKSLVEARKRGVPWMIHTAEALAEVDQVKSDSGLSPVQQLEALGLLTANTLLIHSIFFDHHLALKGVAPFRDMDIVAKHGSSVAHAPYGFGLSCMAMDGYGRYQEAGINVGIGTDTFGHSLLEEMRLVLTLSRIGSGRVAGSTVRDVFHSATVGGAQALGRSDIGRLTRNARADFVLVDLGHPSMHPLNDPLRSLVLKAGDHAIRDVYIDGQKVVGDGKVLTLDRKSIASKLTDALSDLRSGYTETVHHSQDVETDDAGAINSFKPALNGRLGLSAGLKGLANGREVTHGHLSDVPYEYWTPNFPGVMERPLIPYGMSATIDAVVSKSAPGFELDFQSLTDMIDHDWFVQGLSGTGVLNVGGQDHIVEPGTIIVLPRGTSYTMLNRSDKDWVWYSTHPHLSYQYKTVDPNTLEPDDDLISETYARIAKELNLTPDKLLRATLTDGDPQPVPGAAGVAMRQLVLSRHFDSTLWRYDGGAKIVDRAATDNGCLRPRPGRQRRNCGRRRRLRSRRRHVPVHSWRNVM